MDRKHDKVKRKTERDSVRSASFCRTGSDWSTGQHGRSSDWPTGLSTDLIGQPEVHQKSISQKHNDNSFEKSEKGRSILESSLSVEEAAGEASAW